jgi:omega-hydroxy-beta-dihydromenaquinone-9 sulfotransferase
MAKIIKPIIIVGSGRCGSTLFHRLFSHHERTMWLSAFALRFPGKPAWNRRAVMALDNPLVRRLFGETIRPTESYRFWDRYAYGFSRPCRDLVESDVTARVKRQLHAAFGATLSARRDRLLLKITGWPRLGYLHEVFEDAKFIHIIRDGRAVANSLMHVPFWWGWYGPQGWRAGLLSPEDQAVWESYDRSFTALAGLEWRIQMRAMAAARKLLDPRLFMEVKYESLCERPLETFRRVIEFAELPPSEPLERAVKVAKIESTSNRWSEDLTPTQQKILNDVLHEDLRQCGYDDGAMTERTEKSPGRVGG